MAHSFSPHLLFPFTFLHVLPCPLLIYLGGRGQAGRSSRAVTSCLRSPARSRSRKQMCVPCEKTPIHLCGERAGEAAAQGRGEVLEEAEKRKEAAVKNRIKGHEKNADFFFFLSFTWKMCCSWRSHRAEPGRLSPSPLSPPPQAPFLRAWAWKTAQKMLTERAFLRGYPTGPSRGESRSCCKGGQRGEKQGQPGMDAGSTWGISACRPV